MTAAFDARSIRRSTLGALPGELKPEGSNEAASILYLAEFTAFDEPHQFVPFGVRQPHNVGILANRYALLGNFDLRTFRAVRAQSEFDVFHWSPSLIADQPDPTVCSHYRGKRHLRTSSEIAIGELSQRTRCNIETIRYYERIGLLPRPRRQGGRFRRYGTDDVTRLRFIRRARQLGFTLNDVRALLRLANADGDKVRTEMRKLAAAHVTEIRTKIADLRAMEQVLSDAICECESRQSAHCPLLEILSRD
jgi:MerR family mercuric resistance operon transcriptional regulator